MTILNPLIARVLALGEAVATVGDEADRTATKMGGVAYGVARLRGEVQAATSEIDELAGRMQNLQPRGLREAPDEPSRGGAVYATYAPDLARLVAAELAAQAKRARD